MCVLYARPEWPKTEQSSEMADGPIYGHGVAILAFGGKVEDIL